MQWPILIALALIFGFILLLFEIFIIPGFGPVGIGALIFLAIGTYLSWTKLSITWGIGITFFSIVSVIFSIILLKKMGIANRFVLSHNVSEKGPENTHNQKIEVDAKSLPISIGKTGITISDLRPSGIAEFQNRRLNVIADGIYIKRGLKVKIVRIEGNRIFVESETE